MKSKSSTEQPTPAAPPPPPVQVADLVLEETVNREQTPILFTGSARQYRADCQAGQFKIGASRMMGAKLDMELIAARLIEGEFFGYPYQKWLNVIFVDADGIVSTVLLKTESMDNFLEVHRQALATNTILLGKAITARMSKRASRDSGQSYYAVEFELAGDGAYGDAIIQFRRETAVEHIYRILPSHGEPHADADAA